MMLLNYGSAKMGSSDFRLVESDWGEEFEALGLEGDQYLKIICPFVKLVALDRLLKNKSPNKIQVVTRFNLQDMANGVNDIAALRRLLSLGARVKGLKKLHSKVFLFGSGRAIVTSANLTQAAFGHNFEFGFVTEKRELVKACTDHFEKIWSIAGDELVVSKIDDWEQQLVDYKLSGGGRKKGKTLPDFGAKGKPSPPLEFLAEAHASGSAFVKFFGKSNNRVAKSKPIKELIRENGCHRALPYPVTKRPISVENGDTMFISRMAHDDIVIFGEAKAIKYDHARDNASWDDIRIREWQSKWPRFIRVYDADFVRGDLKNGVSLYELVDELGPLSFETTKRRFAAGERNFDVKRSYGRRADVRLSAEGSEWVSTRLRQRFDEHGKVSSRFLDSLDRPEVPNNAIYVPNYKNIKSAIDRFKKIFPGGFDDPYYLYCERSPKTRRHGPLSEIASEISQNFESMSARKIFKSSRFNILSKQEQIIIGNILDSERSTDFLRGVSLFLSGDIESGINLMQEASEDIGRSSWPIITFYPYLFAPDKFVFLKPLASKNLAQQLGHIFQDQYNSKQTEDTYLQFFEFCEDLKAALSELNPKDNIDIQSFIWVVHSYGEAEISKAKEWRVANRIR